MHEDHVVVVCPKLKKIYFVLFMKYLQKYD